MSRLDQLMALNTDFEEALGRGEKWALQHADMVNGLDGLASRRHPERAPYEDGERRNWCGRCSSKRGCIVCDLDNNPAIPKQLIGIEDD